MGINNKGGRLDIAAIPTVGIYIPGPNVVKDEDSNPIDITGATIELHLVEGDCDEPSKTTYTQTLITPASGTFEIAAPASYFSGKWGGEVTYSLTITYSGESQSQGLLYGNVLMQEAI